MSQEQKSEFVESIEIAEGSARGSIENETDGFPAGFVHVHVSGNSDFVREFKKKGRENDRNQHYEIGGVHITKDSYKGGYRIKINSLPYQNVNVKEKAYRKFLNYMRSEGYLQDRVEAYINSRLD